MKSMLWSCKFVYLFAGLVTVVNAQQCITTNLLFRIFIRPTSSIVEVSNDVTLACSLASPLYEPDSYSWHRVNGNIPSHASGQNTTRLTIKGVVSGDEGQYYCMASSFMHCAVSNHVTVIVKTIPCPSLTNPSNGTISCSLGDDKVPSYEDTCSFTCNDGYELSGSETRTCESVGTWSGNTAICRRISCPPLDSPSNGMITCTLEDDEDEGDDNEDDDEDDNEDDDEDDNEDNDDEVPSYEDICSFTCDTGYELTGSENRTCQSDGSWSGSDAMCERISCPSLTDPSNGMINCSLGNDEYEDTCSFTCNDGYELTGSENRTCQSDGSWSGISAMCKRISCLSLVNPSNGLVSCSLGDDGVPSFEDTCSFTCDTGYELTGSDTRTCQNDGSWSGSTAMCSRISCPSLTDPSNGTISCSLGDDGVPSYEDTCSFTCDTGYELTGSDTRTCQSNGSWSGSDAVCQLSCPIKGQVQKNCTADPSCATTCANRFFLRVCPLNCTADRSGCECPEGTIIDEDRNECVTPDKCPEIPCPGEGQSFTSNCHPLNATCSNPFPPIICDAPMCSCPMGQALNEEINKCINVSECRNCTVEGQTLKQCGLEPSCATTCISRFNFNFCPEVCTGVCECPTGAIIDEDSNKCVPESECPEIPCPGKGQIFAGGCNPVNATCSNPNPGILCDVGICTCPTGEVLDEFTNTCINVSHCNCTIKGQIRKECASHPNCTKTCNNTFESTPCDQQCVPYGCECPDGKVVDEDRNECIDTIECPIIHQGGNERCPQLDNPSNGTVSCSLGDDGVPTVGDTCNFTCDTGYELTGSDTRTCQSNRSWSGGDVVCQSICRVNKITGKLRKENSNVILTFSADHPDAYFRCRPAGAINFEDCESPKTFGSDVRIVTVRAYCSGDDKTIQKRKKIKLN